MSTRRKRGREKRDTHCTRAIVTNLHQLLIYQLHTPQCRCLQKLNLRLHQQVKRHLRYEKTRSRTRRVAYGRTDVLVVEVACGVNGRERAPEDVVEDVVDPCAARKLFSGYVDFGAFDRGDEVSRELCHESEDEAALLLGMS